LLGSIHGRVVFRVIVDRHEPISELVSHWVDVCV
jgi:hypothetical protein